MNRFDRRQFIKTSLAGAAALSLPALPRLYADEKDVLGPVKLGKSGLKVSRVAFGTGTHGSNRSSKQTRLGMTQFVDLAQHNYESGIHFFDAADSYGSHPYLKEALNEIPRDKITLMSKLWNRPSDWANFTTAQTAVDRFRKELDTDYIDIVLMHCMVDEDWPIRYKKVCDDLSELKVKGVIGSYGVSCHTFWALRSAVESDWTEVILARVNNTGTLMDHYPNVVVPLLQKAREKDIGVIGMKIFGGGKTKTESERESSLQFVWNSGAVDAMSLGLTSFDETNDALKRVKRILTQDIKQS